MTLILRMCLSMENRRREYLSIDDYNREASIEEPCDWVNTKDIDLCEKICFILF